jgi:hypothetical protein
MDELSEVQLAMVLAMSVLTVLVFLLVALTLVSIAAANKERWSLAVAIGASMIIISMKIMRYPMRYMSFVPTWVRRCCRSLGYSNVIRLDPLLLATEGKDTVARSIRAST